MKYKRIMIFVIIFLSIIITAEALYLFIGKPFFIKKDTKSGTLNTSSQNTTQTTTTCKPEASVENCQAVLPPPNENQAIAESQLSNLRVLRKGLVKTSTIHYTMDGFIDGIEYLETGAKPRVKVILTGDKRSSAFSYATMPNLTVKKADGTVLTLLDLKKNDHITIDVIFDLLEEAYLQIDITVL